MLAIIEYFSKFGWKAKDILKKNLIILIAYLTLMNVLNINIIINQILLINETITFTLNRFWIYLWIDQAAIWIKLLELGQIIWNDFMKSTYFQTAINKYTVRITALFKSFQSVKNSKISDLAQFKRMEFIFR